VSRSKPRRKIIPPDPAVRQPKPRASHPAAAVLTALHLDLTIPLGLILSVLAVYSQVAHFDFVSVDDPVYITRNVHVSTGLTPDNMQWALTAVVDANWVPVTMFSHMAVCEFFGIRSGMHHAVNVVFHALAAVLLFAWLSRATRALWPSAFVAFVFALHPLHVESVAWVSERKDVLSAFFFFLALYAYVRYAERPSPGRYSQVMALYCLGLMAKPMLVTFPFILLLLDGWPLRRAQFPRTLWEKIPFFAFSLVSSVVAYFAQQSSGMVQAIPVGESFRNALMSYIGYIGQMFWPAGLAIFYPYRTSIMVWQAACAFAIIAGISLFAVFAWRARPYFAAGWFWYLGTLVPVIGLVQVGVQSHADRYMYIPMVGLTVMLAWGAADVVRKWPQAETAVASAAVISCVACLGVASAQAEYWRNSETLYRRAIHVTKNNYKAEYNLGGYLMDIPGRGPEAASHLEAAVRMKPDSADAHDGLAGYLLNTGHDSEAIAHFETALRLRPNDALIHFNLGVAFSKNPARILDAVAQFEAALRENPQFARAHRNLGILFPRLGRRAEAISHFEAAQRLQYDPETAEILDALRAGPR